MDKNKNYIAFLTEASRPDDADPNDSIILSNEEKTMIYMPWKHSVIIKMVGKKVSHQYLKKRLNKLWKPTEILILIDLGWDFFIAKFKLLENMQKALQEGPWFILGILLSVRLGTKICYTRIHYFPQRDLDQTTSTTNRVIWQNNTEENWYEIGSTPKNWHLHSNPNRCTSQKNSQNWQPHTRNHLWRKGNLCTGVGELNIQKPNVHLQQIILRTGPLLPP